MVKRLTLRNFRQFRDAEIEFSTDPDQNITVIHGQNGSGKTTILNAFLWVLFERLQSIKRPNRLANQGAMAAADVGTRVTVEVELEFEQDRLHHEVRREQTVQKQDDTDFEGTLVDERFTVEYVTASGNVEEPSNPESYVRQIIPGDLADLFFFGGEFISDLSGVDNQDEIQQAIRQMMGLTIIERSIDHLDWVEGKFRKELRDAGSKELETLINERDDIAEERDQLEADVEDKRNTKKRLQEEVQDINQLLEQLGETRELQEKRQELEDAREELEAKRDELNDELESLIAERGFLTFVIPAIRETAGDLDQLRAEGKIPSELDNGFVDELLEEPAECICGRPLEPGSEHAAAVKSYKSDVSASGLDQAAIRLISHLSNIRQSHDEFFEEVSEFVEKRGTIGDEIERISGEISDIGTKIEELGESITDLDTEGVEIEELDLDAVESASDLEAARASKRETIESLVEDIAVDKAEIERLKERLEQLGEEIDEAEAEQREAELARKRMQGAKAVREELELYYEQFQQNIRERANERVDDTFSEIATKDYQATITDRFELGIMDRDHGTPVEVDKSRGERQIASLAFIGSLVDIAREQYESNRDTEYFTGGIYPIVMDSPFGSLDKDHRGKVSQVLPKMADQVVVMVTDSQWEDPVAEQMGPKVGAHYDLEFDEDGGVNGSPVTDVQKVERRAEVTG